METIKCPKCNSENLNYVGNDVFSCKDCGVFFSTHKADKEATNQSVQEHHNTISQEEIDSWPKDISNRAAKEIVQNLYDGEEILATAYSSYSPICALLLIPLLILMIALCRADGSVWLLVFLLILPFPLVGAFKKLGRGSNYCIALTTKRVILMDYGNISYIRLDQISSIDIKEYFYYNNSFVGGTIIELYSKATEGMTLVRVNNGKKFYNILEKYYHQSH